MSARKPTPDSFLPLTPRVFQILLALADGDSHGYAIMHAVAERSDGRVKIGPGTLYEAVHRLTASGLLRGSTTLPTPDEDQRRLYYALTPLGKSVLRLETERIVDLAQLAVELTSGWNA